MNKVFFLSLVSGFGVLVLALLLVVGLQYLPEKTELALWADNLARQAAPWSEAIFVLASGVLCSVFVPRQGLAFAAGFVFGPVLGTALMTGGTTIGCALNLFTARLIGRKPLERRYESRMRRWNEMIRKAPFLAAVTIRLFPSGSNVLFSLVAGLSRVQARSFIMGSALGYIPQNMVFALLGSGARVAPGLQTTAALVLFVTATALGFYIYRKIR